MKTGSFALFSKVTVKCVAVIIIIINMAVSLLSILFLSPPNKKYRREDGTRGGSCCVSLSKFRSDLTGMNIFFFSAATICGISLHSCCFNLGVCVLCFLVCLSFVSGVKANRGTLIVF